MGLLSKLRSFLYRRQTTAYFWNLRQKYLNSRCRLTRWYYFQKHQRLMEKCCASIPVTAQIAGVPILPHGLSGIYISAGAKLGKNCVLFHQVSIGSNTLPGSKGQGFPTLGDNVYVGAGAKIIGGITIGNNVRIGANCVVTENVPDNATVVMERPRIIVKDAPQDNTFIPQYRMQP